jgi:hypothetical protein
LTLQKFLHSCYLSWSLTPKSGAYFEILDQDRNVFSPKYYENTKTFTLSQDLTLFRQSGAPQGIIRKH